MAGIPIDISRVEALPFVGDLTRAALHTSRVVMVRARPFAGPFAGLLSNAEERLYEHEKNLARPTETPARRLDLSEPFEMTAARRAAIERAARASRLDLAAGGIHRGEHA